MPSFLFNFRDRVGKCQSNIQNTKRKYFKNYTRANIVLLLKNAKQMIANCSQHKTSNYIRNVLDCSQAQLYHIAHTSKRIIHDTFCLTISSKTKGTRI